MYQRAAKYLQRGQSVCIASHLHPDGDAVGSLLALGLGVLELGKKVVLFNGDGVPSGLQFLPRVELVTQTIHSPDRFDTLILVDCAQPRRAGEPIEALAKRLPPFLIDHHLVPDIDHSAHCIDPKAASTGEVVYHILRVLGCDITLDIATNVYTTIVTDTGHFRYSNATPEALRLAADLVELGVSPWHVANNLMEQNHPATYAVLRRALGTIQLELSGRYASMTLTQEMLQEAEALPEYAEEFVGYPRSIAGVEVAALFRELPDRRWKVSLRSKRFVDVAAITALFGGGGHEHAAGCTFECGLAQARQQIAKSVTEALKQRPERFTAAR